MESYSEEDEQDERFFDSYEEEIPSAYEDCTSSSTSVDFDFKLLNDPFSDVWSKLPDSVHDRRNRFLKLMDLDVDRNSVDQEELTDESLPKVEFGIDDRLMDANGAVLRTSGSSEGVLSSTESPMSSKSFETRESFEDGSVDDNFANTIRNLDDGTEFVVDEVGQDGLLSRLRKVGSNHSLSFEEFQRTIGISPMIQRLSRTYGGETKDTVEVKQKTKRSWLRRLGKSNHLTRMADKCNGHESTGLSKMQRVKVHPSKKRSKELSSLYTGQEFLAHNGSILTMKFSPDGQYLASGGEDGVVRVWKVIEDDRLEQFHTLAKDASCVYFTMNHLSEIASLDVDKMKIDKTKKHLSSDSTCVIFPPKVFRVLEKPLHEFHGHSGEVLDLSWSKKRFLLSSSVDMTVRLWQVGCDRCLRVFSHNNYVTCVDFNPVDDNYFISGSIDGKVRIWEVVRCLVVNYTVIREIVTAVCYHPGGKGAIVGTMTGKCLFYDIIDNDLRLDAEISLQGKKKLTGKRITGFEFSPSDPSKVVVTSADSLVRVLSGIDVICKFKASSSIGTAANQMYASFTSDGKHVVSTSEDSNVYLWNYNSQEKNPSRAKNNHSYESFASQSASVAIPWPGMENVQGPLVSPTSSTSRDKLFGELDDKMLPSSPDCFSLTRGLLLDTLTRGSATWPEEKLPDSSSAALSPTRCKEYKFLKSACNSILNSPHLWGLVVVTAGWDGRIRTYLNYGLPLRI